MILNLIKFAFSERKFSDGEDMTNREGLFCVIHSLNSIAFLTCFKSGNDFQTSEFLKNIYNYKISNLY